MNLDDLDRMRALDPDGMRRRIDELPEQVALAWGRSESLPLPPGADLNHIVFAGMGGSAIGADLASVHARRSASAGLTLWREYGLPRWAAGPATLVVVSSHSGNTEETLSAYARAKEVGARRIVFTSGGELSRMAAENGDPVWPIEHPGPPRAAVGFSFAYSLRVLARLGQVEDPSRDVDGAVRAMQAQRQIFRAESPVVQNPAKRMAGQLMDRWPILFGAGVLAPVARRWRTQINELAKAPAQFEEIPEADHNVVAGTSGPESLIGKTMAIFLRAPADEPALTRRIEATRHVLMVEGYNTDSVDGVGESRLAQQWTCLHYGDYAAYYLAMAYGVDPTPIPAIEHLKEQLRG
ncbi:MAG TPA: bifunctional phosphoglucose/phosphomannose isomerase [Anaerolineales bacterium]|nr:bifunctional phosphoglucose/phosphomannose isomerase [Anaerolineales bacterium]